MKITDIQVTKIRANQQMLEYSASRSPLRWELTNEQFDIAADGRVAVPHAPGLGVSFSPEALRQHRVARG